MNIRQLINLGRLNKDTRLLMEQGVVSDHGNLTDLGRRVLADIVFEDYKAQVVDAVRKTVEAEKADK